MVEAEEGLARLLATPDRESTVPFLRRLTKMLRQIELDVGATTSPSFPPLFSYRG